MKNKQLNRIYSNQLNQLNKLTEKLFDGSISEIEIKQLKQLQRSLGTNDGFFDYNLKNGGYQDENND